MRYNVSRRNNKKFYNFPINKLGITKYLREQLSAPTDNGLAVAHPGGGGYSGFQVTGMIEGFFGVEIFDYGIFWGTKIWQAYFG